MKVSVSFCSIVYFVLSFVSDVAVLVSFWPKTKSPTVLISVHLFVFLLISSCLSHFIFLPVLYLC